MVASVTISPRATSMDTAIAMSNAEPLLGRSAGDRFTVTRLFKVGIPQENRAARTLSFASRRDASGNPTSVVPTIPGPTWVWTSTGVPVKPSRATP